MLNCYSTCRSLARATRLASASTYREQKTFGIDSESVMQSDFVTATGAHRACMFIEGHIHPQEAMYCMQDLCVCRAWFLLILSI